MARTSKRKRRIRVLILLVVLLSAGYFFLDRQAKKRGYDSGWAFLTSTSSNYLESQDPAVRLSIDIDEASFAKLQQVRDEALERGVIVQPEDPYVPCIINYNGEKVRAKIRLKGKMTDHVEGDKWSFRVLTKKNDAVLGMKRFSLQHPGTRNYFYEWIFHQLCEEQDLITLRYQFVSVAVNGNDLGVYALEEHFGQEIAENNQRSEGPIFRFDPNLYWFFRLHELEKVRPTDEYTKYQSAKVDPFNEKLFRKDSTLKAQFEQALLLMEQLRRGEVEAVQVLDVEKFARRHAILDLVGGQHSADWSDVKFYFNPQTLLVEPISYESFGGKPIDHLLGQYKYLDPDVYDYDWDFHDALWQDKVFFEAYVNALYEFSDPAFLEDFFTRNDSLIQQQVAIIHSEFPFKEYKQQVYTSNARIIRENLDIPKAFHAYLQDVKDDRMVMKVGSIESMPFEIFALTVNDTLTVKDLSVIVPAKYVRKPVEYKSVEVMNEQFVDLKKVKKVQLHYRMLGGRDTLMAEVFPWKQLDQPALDDNYLMETANWSTLPSLIQDNKLKVLHFGPGEHHLNHNLVVPQDYVLRVSDGATINMVDSAKIICYGRLQFEAIEELGITVTSFDSSGQGILLINAEQCNFTNVLFENLAHPAQGVFAHRAAINAYRSNVYFKNCVFTNIHAPKCVEVTDANAGVSGGGFYLLQGDAVQFNFVEGIIANVTFRNIEDDGIVVQGGEVVVKEVNLQAIKGTAIVAKEHAYLTVAGVTVNSATLALEAMNHGVVSGETIAATSCEVGLWSHKKGDVYGPSTIDLKAVKLEGVAQEYRKGKSSRIIIGAQEISPGKAIKKQ